MKQTRSSANNPPATKTRLVKINQQLTNLDKEINEIKEELNVSRSLSSDDLIRDVVSSSSQKHCQKLYEKSVEVMNRRAECHINEYEDDIPVPQYRCNIHIKGYRPPSERIFDINEKKISLMNQLREEREREINEHCTFRPEINQRSKDIKYDPSHLIKPRKLQQPKKNGQAKGEASKKNNIAIYERQIQKQLYVQPEKENGNVITPRSEKQMIDRLTKHKETSPPAIEDNNNNIPKKFATKQGLNRLVAQSIKKDVCEDNENEKKPKSLMNKKSKEITKNKKVDLFEEYLTAKERIRQRNEEVMEWRQLNEEKENENIEPKKYPKIDITKNPKVAGMDDFIERMKSRPLPKEEDPSPGPIPPIIPNRPFNFELREKMKKPHASKEVDEILNDINELLRNM